MLPLNIIKWFSVNGLSENINFQKGMAVDTYGIY